MGELTQLEILDLSKNKQVGVDGTGISGGIPAEIGNLKLLTTLVLFENRLTGELVPFLLWLSLYSLVKYSTHVASFLFLSISGAMPVEIGGLTELEVLHLKSNTFSVGLLIDSCKFGFLCNILIH